MYFLYFGRGREGSATVFLLRLQEGRGKGKNPRREGGGGSPLLISLLGDGGKKKTSLPRFTFFEEGEKGVASGEEREDLGMRQNQFI